MRRRRLQSGAEMHRPGSGPVRIENYFGFPAGLTAGAARGVQQANSSRAIRRRAPRLGPSARRSYPALDAEARQARSVIIAAGPYRRPASRIEPSRNLRHQPARNIEAQLCTARSGDVAAAIGRATRRILRVVHAVHILSALELGRACRAILVRILRAAERHIHNAAGS